MCWSLPPTSPLIYKIHFMLENVLWISLLRGTYFETVSLWAPMLPPIWLNIRPKGRSVENFERSTCPERSTEFSILSSAGVYKKNFLELDAFREGVDDCLENYDLSNHDRHLFSTFSCSRMSLWHIEWEQASPLLKMVNSHDLLGYYCPFQASCPRDHFS